MKFAPTTLQRSSGRLRPGVLSAPSFGGRTPWVSMTARGPGSSWVGEALSALGVDAPAPERAVSIMAAMRKGRVGGRFWAPPAPSNLQYGAIVLHAPSATAAEVMIGAILQRRELLKLERRVLICAPARVWARDRAVIWRGLGLEVALGPIDPWSLLDIAAELHVYGEDAITVLGLIAGVAVHCHAPCDLGGWGLTHDAPGLAAKGIRTLAQAVQASLIDGALYIDPFSGRPSSCEATIDLLGDWRRILTRNRQIGGCLAMSIWKQPAISDLLASGPEPVRFHRRTAPGLAAVKTMATRLDRGVATKGHTPGYLEPPGLAVWASRAPEGLEAEAASAGVPLVWVEDGFIRSLGLGSDLTPPCSVTVDRRGPHYAPEAPSDLETILSETAFSADLVQRAEALIRQIVKSGVTKYNIGGAAGISLPSGRRTVLVPGQVEDDHAFRLGGAGIQTNLELLARARAAEPNAFILYKPHPDVQAGHRRGAVPPSAALAFADRIVSGVNLIDLLAAVDVVHVLSSLTGFEALLRRREVVVHGQPFYAGWGLTRDLAPPPRRGRQLTLAELVAGTLILYPRYVDPVSRLPCPPEVLVARLAQMDTPSSAPPHIRARQLQGWLTARLRDSARPVWSGLGLPLASSDARKGGPI